MEIKIGKGLRPDPIDERDYIYKPLGAGAVMTDEDWKAGYDIEEIIGHKITPKNQYSSQSCVGQAVSTYVAVVDKVETKIWNENSAKAIYSQVSLGYNQGAYLRDGIKLIKEWGSLYEIKLKSYKENGTTDEDFMRDKSWINAEMESLAKTLQAKDYRLVVGMGIDIFARAIKDGYGALIGVNGENNNTWFSEYPAPPSLTTPQNKIWGHALYAGKFKIENGKKYIGVLNSWGDKVGKDGWQWLGEEWFADEGRWIFNPWTLIDKPNNNNDMITFKKEKLSPHIWYYNEKQMTKSKIVDMVALDVLSGGDYVEVDRAEIDKYKFKGTIVTTEHLID